MADLIHVQTKRLNVMVRTAHIFPPIPIRNFDWIAYDDGNEEGPTGFGRTQQDAIDNFCLQADQRE